MVIPSNSFPAGASPSAAALHPANEKAAIIDMLNISTTTHRNDFFIFDTPFPF
jgi:hypothetical protein